MQQSRLKLLRLLMVNIGKLKIISLNTSTWSLIEADQNLSLDSTSDSCTLIRNLLCRAIFK